MMTLVRIFLMAALAAVASANCGSSNPDYTGEIRIAAPNVQILYKVEGAFVRIRATLLSGAGVCAMPSQLKSFPTLSQYYVEAHHMETPWPSSVCGADTNLSLAVVKAPATPSGDSYIPVGDGPIVFLLLSSLS